MMQAIKRHKGTLVSEVLALRHKTFLSTNFAKERRNGTDYAGKNNFQEDKHEKKIVIGFSRCDDGADYGTGGICGGYGDF